MASTTASTIPANEVFDLEGVQHLFTSNPQDKKGLVIAAEILSTQYTYSKAIGSSTNPIEQSLTLSNMAEGFLAQLSEWQKQSVRDTNVQNHLKNVRARATGEAAQFMKTYTEENGSIKEYLVAMTTRALGWALGFKPQPDHKAFANRYLQWPFNFTDPILQEMLARPTEESFVGHPMVELDQPVKPEREYVKLNDGSFAYYDITDPSDSGYASEKPSPAYIDASGVCAGLNIGNIDDPDIVDPNCSMFLSCLKNGNHESVNQCITALHNEGSVKKPDLEKLHPQTAIDIVVKYGIPQIRKDGLNQIVDVNNWFANLPFDQATRGRLKSGQFNETMFGFLQEIVNYLNSNPGILNPGKRRAHLNRPAATGSMFTPIRHSEAVSPSGTKDFFYRAVTDSSFGGMDAEGWRTPVMQNTINDGFQYMQSCQSQGMPSVLAMPPFMMAQMGGAAAPVIGPGGVSRDLLKTVDASIAQQQKELEEARTKLSKYYQVYSRFHQIYNSLPAKLLGIDEAVANKNITGPDGLVQKLTEAIASHEHMIAQKESAMRGKAAMNRAHYQGSFNFGVKGPAL